MSCEVKKKQRACTFSGLHDHYSELFTWTAALNYKIVVTYIVAIAAVTELLQT